MLVTLLRISTVLVLGVAILASMLTAQTLVIVGAWVLASWVTCLNEAVIRLLSQRTGE